jgi:hypothetical protein
VSGKHGCIRARSLDKGTVPQRPHQTGTALFKTPLFLQGPIAGLLQRQNFFVERISAALCRSLLLAEST